jgi:hypothetical protein
MNKYSAEDRRRIMAEARRNIERPRPVIDAAPPAPVQYRTINAPAEPEPPQRTLDPVDWSGYIGDRIAEAIVAERKHLLQAIGEALGKQLRDLDDGFEDIKAHLDRLDELLKSLRAEDRTLDWPTARRAAAVN